MIDPIKTARDEQDAREKRESPKLAFKRRLSVIWSNTGRPEPYRYVARAIPDRSPGSMGWDVYDRKLNKFITGRKAIPRLTFEDCGEMLVN